MRILGTSAALLLLLSACGGDADPAPAETANRRDAVCRSWAAARDAIERGGFTGAVDRCEPGDAPDIRRAAVELANAYRFLAGLPPVTNRSDWDAKAQQCAVLMHANRAISHQPPSTWACYTQDAREAASSSNVAGSNGADAVDAYMLDFGSHNASTLGHRRWLLSPLLEEVGVGSTDAFSCMWVVHPMQGDETPFVAWPPPGPVPAAIWKASGPSFPSLDATGWSIQSNAIELAGAAVRVLEDGAEKPVQTSALKPYYGSLSAIRIVPSGWTVEPGRTYRVEVAGVDEPFAYELEVVDCDAAE